MSGNRGISTRSAGRFGGATLKLSLNGIVSFVTSLPDRASTKCMQIVSISVALLSVILVLPMEVQAHPGHDHPAGRPNGHIPDLNGHIPGQPDFERIRGVTIRFHPASETYSLERPGAPTVSGHVHGSPEQAAGEYGDEAAESGLWYPLTTFENTPQCATTGHRIVIVRAYNEGSGSTPDEADEEIRSIVRRMNWKFHQQSDLSSDGQRILEMKVGCDEAAAIDVHDVEIPLNAVGPGFDTTDGIGVVDIVDYVEYVLGSPGDADAVKYLVFGEQNFAGLGGVAWLRNDLDKSDSDTSSPTSNGNRTTTTPAFVAKNSWEYGIPIHELTHTMGAVLTAGPGSPEGWKSPPYSTTNGAHCVDGIDLMCYKDGSTPSEEWGPYSETRCPASAGYGSALGVPLDCMYDTYFDALAEPGEWLDQFWNIGGSENPFLIEPVRVPTLLSSFGTNGSGNGQFKRPLGMAVDAEGNLWVADRDNHRVQKFNSKGEYVSQFGTSGSGNGQFAKPTDVAITSGGDLWVVDGGNYRVQKFNSKGEYQAQFGSFGNGNGQFKDPAGIAIAPNGHLWVVDRFLTRVAEFTASGEFVRNVGTGGSGPGQLVAPQGVAVDAEGSIWVADRNNHRVQKFSSSGEYLSQFGSEGESDGKFKFPTAIEVTSSGALLVADRSTGRVQLFSEEGVYVTQFGKGQHSEPEGIAVASDGSIYVASSAANSVKKWGP
jgi:DNA-binding beta-propeller fold protein YncE